MPDSALDIILTTDKHAFLFLAPLDINWLQFDFEQFAYRPVIHNTTTSFSALQYELRGTLGSL